MKSRIVKAGLGVFLLALGCSETDEAADAQADGQGQDDGGKADQLGRQAQDDFFAPKSFYYTRISGWDSNKMSPQALGGETTVYGAELKVFKSDAKSNVHCPDAEAKEGDLLHSTKLFSLRTSGNFTNGTPKSSYKVKFTEKEGRMFDVRALNLKSMWNDVSQMRESLVWSLFQAAGVHAPRHTYTKFCIKDKYYGLYSVVEQIDETFVKNHFGKNDKGNLYKVYWEDLGPGDLTYRKSSSGDDSGKQYFKSSNIDNRTYQLKTNNDSDDDKALQTYDDLALFIKTLNGIGLPGQGDEVFKSDAYRQSMEKIFDVKGFLRWAAVNLLAGAWDNYWGTPSNYYLYNSGKKGAADGFMQQPYFTWLPWDYDNTLGRDVFNANWQYADIVDWEKTTKAYHGEGKTSQLPLIRNLLKNDAFLAYYLDFMEWMVGTYFKTSWFDEQIGNEGSGGLWDRVRTAAFLEADGPAAPAHTGRRYTNDQVYWNGFKHQEMRQGNEQWIGIIHYVRMRHDSAQQQLTKLRERIPKGTSGATFPTASGELPAAVL